MSPRGPCHLAPELTMHLNGHTCLKVSNSRRTLAAIILLPHATSSWLLLLVVLPASAAW